MELKEKLSKLIIMTVFFLLSVLCAYMTNITGIKVAHAEERKEIELTPDEKCWLYKNITNEDNHVIGIRIVKYEDFVNEDSNTYKLIVPESIAGKKVLQVGIDVWEDSGIGSDFCDTDLNITSIKLPEGVTKCYRLYAENLENVYLPNSLEEIGYAALANTKIESVSIPPNIKKIDSHAFNGCSRLKDISIPEGVVELGGCVFYGCDSLINITLPASLTSIDMFAFVGCKSLQGFQVASGNAKFVAQDGVLIEKYRQPRTIRVVKENNQGEILSILETKEMDCCMFCYPAGKSGNYKISANMEIGANPFEYARRMTEISVEEGHPYCESIEGVLYSKDVSWDYDDNDILIEDSGLVDDESSWYLQTCPAGKTGEFTVPNDISDVREPGFAGSSLTTIHMSNCERGLSTLYDCNLLENLFLGEKITAEEIIYCLGKCALSKLKAVTVSSDNPNIKSIDNVIYNKNGTNMLFIPRGRTNTLFLPATLEKIDENIFEESKIQEVSIGKDFSIKLTDDIFEEYLYPCNIYNNYRTCKEYIVDGENASLTAKNGILYSKDMKRLYMCPGGVIGSIIIPDGVEVIEPDAFGYCGYVETEENTYKSIEITIPSSVTKMDFCWIRSADNVVIRGYKGSVAETYAKERNITFIALTGDYPQVEGITLVPNSTLYFTTDGFLTGIKPGENTVQKVCSNFSNDNLICKDSAGKILSDTDILGTGSTISITEGTTEKAVCTIVMTGDIYGDGKIDGKDISLLLQYRLGKKNLTEEQIAAGDVYKDGKLDGKDVSKLLQYRLGKIESLE